MEQRLSFITLGVANLARSLAFYEALGWKPSKYGLGEGVVFFQAGGMVLALFPREDLAKDAGVENTPPGGFGGFSISYNTRTRDEVDAVMAEAKAAGGRIVKPAQDVFWGGYCGYFADPDGCLWEAVFNPKAEIAPDGAVRIP